MEHKITHHTVPRETFDATDRLIHKCGDLVDSYADALMWWNRRINLVSRDVSRETIAQHIHHSLVLSNLNVFKKSNNIVDTGTGGGLPGIPLALTHSVKTFLLNDIVSKKVLAVKDIVRKLGLSNIEAIDGSVSKMALNDPFLLVSKHAFKINDLYRLSSHFPWSAMVFYKGENFDEELNDIDTPLNISAYDLSQHSGKDFYKGKLIIVVTR